MPLKPGKSKAVIAENFHEFHQGPTYARTKAKYGKKRADKQAVAVVLSNARKRTRIASYNPAQMAARGIR